MEKIILNNSEEQNTKRRLKCYLYDEPNIISDEVENFFHAYEELRGKFTAID